VVESEKQSEPALPVIGPSDDAAARADRPKISVIIPVKNQSAKLEACLTAVLAQRLPPCEVIVVDGRSTDGTIEVARRFPVTLLFEDYHTRAGACQVGIEAASGDFIAFTDADCIPDPAWLENLASGFQSGVAGVGGLIKNVDRGFWVRSVNLAYGTFLGSANSVQGRNFNRQRYVNSISGCNSMYRRADLVRAGGFNPALPGCEDADLNSRIIKLGHLVFQPQALVRHDHGRGLKDFTNMMFRYGRDRAVAKKFGLPVVVPLLVPLLLLSLLLNVWILPSALALYALLLLVMGSWFAVKERDIRYLPSIVIVYLVQHVFYTLGFWRGLLFRR
jgi:GT2 family glycosyltransferase